MATDPKNEAVGEETHLYHYAQRPKKQVTLRLDLDNIAYFKALAKETGIAYQPLINMYLADCATAGRKLSLTWA
ncbi:MAG: BrnA antitoxin family protein [Propionibacteriaceae bacterium]|nr:BrnA antitoxin family protein [Propionibacteriaceae bacterium]